MRKQKYDKEYKLAYYHANKDKLKAFQRARYEKDPETWKLNVRKRRLRLNFWPQLTADEAYTEYMRLIYLQDNKCAICKKPETKLDPQRSKICMLAVDHCHRTKKVRGLLCFRCNTNLGSFENQIDAFLAYLTKHEAA